MRALTLGLGLTLLFALGCRSEEEPAEANNPVSEASEAAQEAVESGETTVGEAMATLTSAKVGCAGCIYNLEGAQGCQLAVKVGGEAMFVTGDHGINAHTAGLCSGEKDAQVAGEVVDGKFVATKVEIQ